MRLQLLLCFLYLIIGATLFEMSPEHLLRFAGLLSFTYLNPGQAYLINLFIVDGLDCRISSRPCGDYNYHQRDKLYDSFVRIIALVSLLEQQPVTPTQRAVLVGLLLHRQLGEALYLTSDQPVYFFLFPNLFEVYWFTVYFKLPGFVFLLLAALKLFQEYWLHVEFKSFSSLWRATL